MLVLFVITLIAAMVIALAAYLQFDSRWWTGPLIALGLMAAGALFIFLSLAAGVFDTTDPVALVPVILIVCAGLVGLGAISALVLRRFMNVSKAIKLVFLCSWAVLFSAFWIAAFT